MKTECFESTQVGSEGNWRLTPGKFFLSISKCKFSRTILKQKHNAAVISSRNQDILYQKHP